MICKIFTGHLLPERHYGLSHTERFYKRTVNISKLDFRDFKWNFEKNKVANRNRGTAKKGKGKTGKEGKEWEKGRRKKALVIGKKGSCIPK